MSPTALKALPPAEPAAVEPILISMKTGAKLIDSTVEGLRARFRRSEMPGGILVKFGKRLVRLHRQRFMAWIEAIAK
jgi:hypothetical protein